MERILDSAAWPLVVVRIPRRFDLPAIESFTPEYDAVLSRKAKFALLVDTTALRGLPNAIERHRIAEGLRARAFAEAAYCLGQGVVIVSTPARAALTAILWLRPPPVPQHVFAHFAQALEWCCGRLSYAGIGLSPEIEALRDQGRASAARGG